ncbi:MAG: AAA family ATPase, partial [Muribaculaceae bacterium]|nr:AAA family ATPase [Muribaculaceae bacterium]
MNSPKPDIQVSGSIIAEFPTDEDAKTFNFGKEIPILPLRNVVAFPGMPVPVPLTNEDDVKIAEELYSSHSCVLAIPTKSPDSEANRLRDFYPYGTVCKIGKVLKMPEMDPVVFLLGGPRARLKKIISKKPMVTGEITVGAELVIEDNYETDYLMENIKSSFDKLLSFVPDHEKQRVNFEVEDIADQPVAGVFFMICNSPLSHEEKAQLLGAKNFKSLLENFVRYLDLALQKLEIQANIHRRTHQALNDQQRNHFLQQQLRNIKEELGEGDASDMGELQERAKKMPWSKEARAHFEKELKKLERFNPSNPEYSIQYSYLDTLLSLPWNKYSPDSFSLSKVEKILDRDHFGLEEVKERIIEHMAVLKLRNDMKAPIICLYGPPGVGKTSLGKSIADALGREYTRVSLGGLHDEAEIRGHRRTYIGAMPGRIIAALEKCGTGNPVFVLDEIDKIGKDFKGDPSTALLEVLDPEQNSKFHDNYLDIDYDLSKILFLATANNLSDISRPLLDRMEIIEISGYIPEEKIEIAARHLVPKSLEEHGFAKNEVTFSKPALELIVNRYTRESGVRQLEKKIAKVLRKVARLKASDKEFPNVIDVKQVTEFLGKE